jgi:hypothetical protein
MLSEATTIGGYISRFRGNLQNTAPLEISHHFVEGTLIMCDADQYNILNLWHILVCFGAILGLKVWWVMYHIRKSLLIF